MLIDNVRSLMTRLTVIIKACFPNRPSVQHGCSPAPPARRCTQLLFTFLVGDRPPWYGAPTYHFTYWVNAPIEEANPMSSYVHACARVCIYIMYMCKCVYM